ncbi:MAG: glycosyltransferase family 4 protein [Kiritimatiellae bacterium]|nr:glycosyltransferase family 4 protein [Kiritimatiellia bacterium]
MPAPRAIYIAFEAFPRPKGASSHIASMVTALAKEYAPVWLLCCGYGDMPGQQVEGDIHIFRHKVYHPNMLRRASEFAAFVGEKLAGIDSSAELCVFRDPWGGVPALSADHDYAAVFEVNALPRWELPYSYPAAGHNAALLAKVEDMERFCLNAADRIITVSPVTRDTLVRLGVEPERIGVVTNSAADTFFSAGANRNTGPTVPQSHSPTVPRSHGPTVPRSHSPTVPQSHGPRFGYFGSLHPWQGVDSAVDAFAMVAADIPDARMLIVHNGRKAPLKALRKRIRKCGLEARVELQHPLDPARLAEMVAELRFTVAPLLETTRNAVQGCCPVKIIESMATGTPVVASDLRAVRHLIQHGQDGLLVPAGQPRAWALAIRRLLTDEPLTQRLAQGARQTAQRRFTQQAGHASLSTEFRRAMSEPAKKEQAT